MTKNIDWCTNEIWHWLQECQRKLDHKLSLDSYLLKPVQRITKYQLLLKVCVIKLHHFWLINKVYFFAFFNPVTLILLERNLKVSREAYKLKQKEIPVYQLSAQFFFSFSQKATSRQANIKHYHRGTMCNFFCPYISAEEIKTLIRKNKKTNRVLQQREESVRSTCYLSVIVASCMSQELALLDLRKCSKSFS